MGSNSGYREEKPVHNVTVSDFNISKTEVTFEQYDVFCDATGRGKPYDEGWCLSISDTSWRFCPDQEDGAVEVEPICKKVGMG